MSVGELQAWTCLPAVARLYVGTFTFRPPCVVALVSGFAGRIPRASPELVRFRTASHYTLDPPRSGGG